MKTASEQLVSLAETMASHQGVTHWAISMRYTSKGDYFARKKRIGAKVDADMFARLLQSFSNDWPSDLEWPADIPRPEPQAKEAAQ